MTAPVLLETLIEAALLAKVAAGTFYAVTYPSNVPTLGANTAPVTGSVQATPISSSFGMDPHNHMKLQHARLDWLWVLEAQWDVRVALEKFERDLIANPPVVPRDKSNDVYQQAELRLIEARYGQPERGENLASSRIVTYSRGAVGTYAIWTFSALLSSYPSTR